MKFLLFLIMFSVSVLSYSQGIDRSKPVICLHLPEVIKNLENNYGEKLEFIVTNQMYAKFITKIGMYRNKETGSWTILEFSDDPVFGGEGCILGSGKDTNS